MPTERDATLQRAEKLLREGKLDAAIGEYVRLTSAHPEDWNSLNALGDLYLRVGQVDRAVAQFARAGERLIAEGALAPAGAVFRKILRIHPGDVRGTRGLERLATRQRGSTPELAPPQADEGPNGLMAAARAAQDAGDPQQACALLIQAADAYEAQGKPADALAAVAEASAIAPGIGDYRLRMLRMLIAQGELTQARCAARTGAELILVADALEEAGRSAEAADTIAEAALADPGNEPLRGRGLRQLVACGAVDRARSLAKTQADLRVIAAALRDAGVEAPEVEPSLEVPQQPVASRPAPAEQSEPAFTRVEEAADRALAEGDTDRALEGLQAFVAREPAHVGALLKLIEICVEHGRRSAMRGAQEQLTDAYLRAGKGAEARLVAEDLVLRAPWERTSVERLLRALVLCGDPEPEQTIANLLCADGTVLLEDL